MKLIITDIENFRIPVQGEYKLINPGGTSTLVPDVLAVGSGLREKVRKRP